MNKHEQINMSKVSHKKITYLHNHIRKLMTSSLLTTLFDQETALTHSRWGKEF